MPNFKLQLQQFCHQFANSISQGTSVMSPYGFDCVQTAMSITECHSRSAGHQLFIEHFSSRALMHSLLAVCVLPCIH
ncbi:hypothetical protein EUGRSUZ_L02662 [Eucalyptus grandis]|uniref:Uncharacterized protein n=1 Tax=Eucalyptus grandis TaxID=71139 RepID=A0AAD9T9B1_EUCGR|nr:hypothetical protein EUGRSUZ_L02662 [Eucalyptus grandis]